MVKPRVIKNYVKNKDEGIQKLTKRSCGTMRKRHLEDITDDLCVVPASLRPSLEPILQKMTQVKNKMALNQPVLREIIEGLPDGRLDELLKIWKPDGVRIEKGYTEDKLIKACYLLLTEIDTVEGWVDCLYKVRRDLVYLFVEVFGKEFHSEQSSDVQFDNAGFVKLIEDLQVYRSGIRRASSTDDPLPAPSDEGSCAIM